ncbi:MAG TPA: nickel pincer cofactor biosynthesis protein LarC [Vicinamibacteria bacterium]|nr:nickel pincer cofactor biosynthesis protein LarC [Vicinamibacteria bacterium]
MSRIVYFDCSAGAAGDMLLGALVELGLPLEALIGELRKLPLEGYRLEARRVRRAGLACTKVEVIVDGPAHGERHLSDILALIEASTLAPSVKERAAALFRRLAEAEAWVHDTTSEKVHFHEVGAIDSIVDIVGGVLGLAWTRADRFVSSPLNVGSGTVSTAHGQLPVPTPATLRLLQGVPIHGSEGGELVTPTGALLVSGHAGGYGPLPPLRSEAVGHGAGTRDTAGHPNVLRVIVGEEERVPAGDSVVVLETEIDDMPPQLLGPLIDRLLAAGALDAFYTPIQMKKGRPGILITVLAPPARREAVEELLFTETTTLGVRRQVWDRAVLERRSVRVETPYGPVAVKVGERGGRVYNVQPEFDDCQAASARSGAALKEVWAAAVAAYHAAAARVP